jgi:YVTN family beta-propeller protein
MKLLTTVVCACTALLSIASGQWLEATVPVPLAPQALCWNPANDRVYCAVGYPDQFGAVAVIDAAANTLLDAVVLDCQMPGGMCVDTAHNRVFCAGSSSYPMEESLVTVIDGTNDSILARIPVGSAPLALSYVPGTNRLYCAAQFADEIAVIDCATYTVVKTHPVPEWPVDMVYAAEVDRVYCVEQGPRSKPGFTVTAIDGSADSVLATIRVGNHARSICYNRTDAKVYTANGFDASVSVVDAHTDSVVATVSVGGTPFAVFWNPVSDHVYCADEGSGTLSVVDGVTNQQISTVPLVSATWSMCLDSKAGKVYCSNYLDSMVTVIDARADTIIKTIATGPDPRYMCYDRIDGRVYVGNQGDNSVSVIKDTATIGVEDEVTGIPGRRPAVHVRPNPCASVLHVDSGPTSGPAQAILVYSVQGSVVGELRPGTNDVRQLASGAYFLGRAGSGPVTKLVVRR